jgi:hypothetical protein
MPKSLSVSDAVADLAVPIAWRAYWPIAVGQDVSLVGVSGMHGACARVINVANVAGSLVLVQDDGTSITFTATHINNANGVLLGRWKSITASGSAAFNLLVGW